MDFAQMTDKHDDDCPCERCTMIRDAKMMHCYPMDAATNATLTVLAPDEYRAQSRALEERIMLRVWGDAMGWPVE